VYAYYFISFCLLIVAFFFSPFSSVTSPPSLSKTSSLSGMAEALVFSTGFSGSF
jgi:hypothetical protein